MNTWLEMLSLTWEWNHLISTIVYFGMAFEKGAAGKRSKASTQPDSQSWELADRLDWCGAEHCFLTTRRLWVRSPGPGALSVWSWHVLQLPPTVPRHTQTGNSRLFVKKCKWLFVSIKNCQRAQTQSVTPPWLLQTPATSTAGEMGIETEWVKDLILETFMFITPLIQTSKTGKGADSKLPDI